jgi:hypothetical protein|tara:strand:+ start:4472 stop:4927 length:456 start_codon:yes stop_codon:yes gene_type:complete
MFLSEVFDSKPVPIKWKTKSKNKWIGDFNIVDVPYRLFFTSEQPKTGSWELSFNIDKKSKLPPELKKKIKKRADLFGIIGTGNAQKVFSTVMFAMRELIKKEKPKTIQFTAEEVSRMKLYKKMVTRFAPSLGYKPVMTGDYFELERIKDED